MANALVVFEPLESLVVARVQGTRRLDQSNCEDFGRALAECVESGNGTHVLVHLDGVEFISSSVLSEFIQAMRIAGKVGGSVRVCAPDAYVASVFEVTHLDRTFHLCASIEEAVAAFTADLSNA